MVSAYALLVLVENFNNALNFFDLHGVFGVDDI